NRRGRHLYLRDRPHEEEVLRADRGPGSSLRDQPSREENRAGLRPALDAVAVGTQVDPSRPDRSPCAEGRSSVSSPPPLVAADEAPAADRQRKRQKPERPSMRPSSLFLARLVIHPRFPDAKACASPKRRAER